MVNREGAIKLGYRIMAIAELLENGHTEVALRTLERVTWGIAPESITHCQTAVDAARQYANDSEMLRIIGQGLIDHALKEGDDG